MATCKNIPRGNGLINVITQPRFVQNSFVTTFETSRRNYPSPGKFDKFIAPVITPRREHRKQLKHQAVPFHETAPCAGIFVLRNLRTEQRNGLLLDKTVHFFSVCITDTKSAIHNGESLNGELLYTSRVPWKKRRICTKFGLSRLRLSNPRPGEGPKQTRREIPCAILLSSINYPYYP